MTRGTFNHLATPVLAVLKGNYAQLWHIQMAGATLTSLPPLALFVFLGRYFVSGLMAGTLKKQRKSAGGGFCPPPPQQNTKNKRGPATTSTPPFDTSPEKQSSQGRRK